MCGLLKKTNRKEKAFESWKSYDYFYNGASNKEKTQQGEEILSTFVEASQVKFYNHLVTNSWKNHKDKFQNRG